MEVVQSGPPGSRHISLYHSAVVPQPIGKLWHKIGNFRAVNAWVPIQGSELSSGAEQQVGAVRKLDAGSGKFIWEQLVAISDLERFYTYTILPYGASNRPLETCAFPGPPLNYKATLRAKPVTADDHTFVEWFANFDADSDEADQIKQQIDELFSSSLASLHK